MSIIFLTLIKKVRSLPDHDFTGVVGGHLAFFYGKDVSFAVGVVRN